MSTGGGVGGTPVAGFGGRTALSAETVRRLGTVSLVANVLVILGLGVLSIPGAFFALRARRLAAAPASDADLASARMALRWSALLLMANLLMYLLLGVVLGIIVLGVVAARH